MSVSSFILMRQTSLASDLVRALEPVDGNQPDIHFEDAATGLAIIQLAGGKAASDTDLSPTQTILTADGTSTGQMLAARFIAEKQLSHHATHYLTLGIPRHASASEVRAAYRKLISLVHPDTRPEGFPVDGASQVNLAYATLSDSVKRAEYDDQLSLAENRGQRIPGNSANAQANRPAGVRERSFDGPREKQTTSRWAGLLRSRAALAVCAALFAVPVVGFLLTGTQPPPHVNLVEARPKLKVDSSVSDTAPAPTASGALAPYQQPQAATPVFTGTSSVEANVSIKKPIAPFAQENRARSDYLILSPSKELNANPAKSAQPLVAVASNATPDTFENADDVKAPKRLSRADGATQTDEVLLRLVDAVSSGRVGQLDALLDSSLSGRAKVVNDFDALFKSTQSREMRLLRVDKFRGNQPGGHGFSGQAELALIGKDGAPVTQRIYISGMISNRSGSPKLTSWASHPLSGS